MFPHHSHSQANQAIRIFLCLVLVLTSLPSQGIALSSAQSVNQDDKKVQSRKETPHKDLPSPKDLLDEGKGLKTTKAKETPLKPPSLCRFRDPNCLLKQLENGGKISTNTAAPKSEGNWLKRMRQKISGALAGASALVNSPSTGHSFLPTTAAVAPAPPPPPPSFASLNEAKLDPHYRVGTGGEDLFSGNYHWSTPLVSLPGRGGLDLNLSLHYNSLQWVRYSNTMFYDPDWRTSYPAGLATGFNMGFPEIESGYFYETTPTPTPAYLVTLPSGYRVLMRRVYVAGSTATYEAVDGSSLYLVVVGSTAPILSTPDGTQYTYGVTSAISGTKRCTQVRDSNGNRINIAYNGSGLLSTITDTLGRILNFSYTGYQLMQITQSWLGQSHVLAQFEYGTPITLSYNFSGLSIDGPASGSPISVLKRVITSDGARHAFVYNGWGIVDDIFRYGATDLPRAAADYNFPGSATPLTTPLVDCPRFNQRNDGIWGFAGQWNDANGLGWVAHYFDLDPNETYGRVATPDGIVHKELFSTTGNTRGLSTGMETWVGMTNWTGGVRRKWTATTWVSDVASRPLYPRVTETNVYDNTDADADPENHRRATIEYWQYTATGTMPYTVYLPKWTDEYAADAATVYRRTETEYLNNTNYWTRWIVGLPSAQRLFEGTTTLQAQTTYSYDDYQTIAHATTINQHDTTNYGIGFYYRGNLTKTQRYSVASGVTSSPTETQAEYQVTGNVAKARDALNHETKFFYEDAFATYADDGSNTETAYNPATQTYAYPTQIQSPAPENYSSYVKYWYDTGAPTRTTDPKGAAALSLYETTYGRLAKSKNAVNGAYTKYIYDTGHNYVQTWSTVNGLSLSDEVAVLSLLDGADRERQHVNEHPGSSGTLSSSYRVYDLMGRVVEWSNPTEISSVNNWIPTGDDLVGVNGPGTGGYVISTQTYDWNHRPLVTTNQDTTTRQISYTGCGCAGSNIIEYWGEEVPYTNAQGQAQTGRRKTRETRDFLGRTNKTEVLNWDGSTYSSTTTNYNVRDQVTQSSLITGTNGAGQNIDTQYDGYGRLWKRKSPLQTTDTIYTYYNDDEIQQVKDARLAAVNYFYNARGLVTDITYAQPPGNPAPTDPLYVAPVQPVHFTYDSAGNRETMTDGIGSVTYAYDTLSRLLSEMRTITELNKSYSLTYDYNLAGQVKQVNFISPSFPNDNVSTYYNFDKTGRLNGVTGSLFAGVTQYASQFNYRAFGTVKAVTYGNTLTSNASYSPRLQLQGLSLNRPDGAVFENKTYTYFNDNRLKFTDDLNYNQFDRAFQYDHAGHMKEAWTGAQARNVNNGLPAGSDTVPYHQVNTYDTWGNRLTQTGEVWSEDINQTDTYNAQTSRNNSWQYDNAGNLISPGNAYKMQYDVAGRNASAGITPSIATQDHDGNSLVVRQDPNTTHPLFYLNSSVLGGKVIAEISGIAPGGNPSIARGAKLASYVYAGNTRIATQTIYNTSSNSQALTWHQIDPLTGTAATYAPNGDPSSRSERDIQGADVSSFDPATVPPPTADPETPSYFGGGGSWNPQNIKFYLDGFPVEAEFLRPYLKNGVATLDPKVRHDYLTLSRAGIMGHWVRNAETQGSDIRWDSKLGSWTMGVGVEAGGSLFVVTGVNSLTSMQGKIQEAKVASVPVKEVSMMRVHNIAMTALMQVPGCSSAFESTTIKSPIMFLNYLMTNNRVWFEGLGATTYAHSPRIGKNAVISFDNNVFAGKKGLEDITMNGQLSFEAALAFVYFRVSHPSNRELRQLTIFQ